MAGRAGKRRPVDGGSGPAPEKETAVAPNDIMGTANWSTGGKMRTQCMILKLAAVPALLLLAVGQAAAANFDLENGPPAVVRFTSTKKVSLDYVTLNCIDAQPNLTFFWHEKGRAVYDFPARNGRRKVPAGLVKKMVFTPYGVSLPGNKFPGIPVYKVLFKLRSGEKIKAVMQVGNIWGQFTGPAPKFGDIHKFKNGTTTWVVDYGEVKTPGNLRLKDISYPPLPGDVDPDAKKK